MKKFGPVVKSLWKNILGFGTENVVVIYFMLMLYVKNWCLILEINQELPHFPTIMYPIIFPLFFAFLFYMPILFVKSKRQKLVIAAAISFLASIVFLIDVTYAHYFNSVPSVALFQIAGQTTGVLPAVLKVFSPLDLFYFSDILIAILGYFFIYKKYEKNASKTTVKTTAIIVLCGLLIGGAGFFVDRNHFLTKALHNVIDNKVTLERYGILGTHLFDIYRVTAQTFHKISEEELQNVTDWISAAKNENEATTSDNDYTGVAAGKNVIMIQVESLEDIVIGASVNGQEVTPNLNALVSESHYFENNYFLYGAGGTSDTDFTVNTSYYPLSDASVLVRYGLDDFTSLAKELIGEGYSTEAFHGYDGSFWNRATAYSSLGFQKFFSNESYSDGYTVGMGLNDETFLEETVEYLKVQAKPSFSYVITLSSHMPFVIDSSLQELNLDGAQCETYSCNYLQAIHYTDKQLGMFIAKLKEAGLYDDSLIVLYGDHSAEIDTFTLDSGYVYNPEDIEDKQVPLIIKLPQQTAEVVHSSVSSTLDVMPTILNLVGANVESFMFGTDLFSGKDSFFASVSRLEMSTIISDNKIYQQLTVNQSSCSAWSGDGVGSEFALNSCNTIVSLKEEIQGISELIVRYNLFEKISAL